MTIHALPASAGTKALSERDEATSIVTLAVENMRCGGCIRSVERAAMSVPGVKSARANLAAKRVSVVVENGRVGEADVIAALEQAGFAAAPMQEAKDGDQTRERAASPRRGIRFRRHEHHAVVRVGVGRARRRHGPESRHAVLLAVGADRAADRRLCRAALLCLGALRLEGAATQHGCADLARHHSRHGDEPLPDRRGQRSGLFRRRGVASVLPPDRPLSR